MSPFLTLRFTLLAGLCAYAMLANAQTELTAFPQDFQLIPRVNNASSATAEIKGNIEAGQGDISLSAKLYAGQSLVAETSQTVRRSTLSSQPFDLQIDVPVTRMNHRLELTRSDQPTPIAVANNLVAGDVYVVNGQSNAVGGFALAEVDRDSFLRGFINNRQWSLLQFSNPGEWMGRAAYKLSKQHDVPVAVFNFAIGARRLGYFMKSTDPTSNYMTALNTLDSAGVAGKITGVCWFQGEADGWEASIRSYREGLTQLLSDYREVYGNDNCYAFQTRTYGCSHPEPFVMEAQRRLNTELDYLTVISTTNAVHDSCHYPYIGGYQLLGDRLVGVINNDQYDILDRSAFSPDVDSARILTANTIALYYNGDGGGMAATGNPWPEFRAEGVTANATSGTIAGNIVTLIFDEDISGASGVSYLSHKGPTIQFLHGQSGVGAFTFFNKTVFRGDGDPGNLSDAELSFQSTQTTIEAGGIFSVNVTLKNTGPTTLSLAEVNVPLPGPMLIYEGGNDAVASIGRFETGNDSWIIPSLAPYSSATLTLNYYVADAANPVVIWAELSKSELADEDSAPGNGTNGEVHEDDEARIVIGDRSRDCNLSIEYISSSCEAKPDSIWYANISASASSAATLNVVGPSGIVTTWDAAASSNLELQLEYDELVASNNVPLQLLVQHPSDATCRNPVTVMAPDSCAQDPVIIDNTYEAILGELVAYPVPARAGGELTLTLTEAIRYIAPIELYSITGSHAHLGQLPAGADRIAVQLPPTLASGIYTVVVSNHIRQIIVH